MKILELFNINYEVSDDKKFIKYDERIINVLEKPKKLKIQLKAENDKRCNQELAI